MLAKCIQDSESEVGDNGLASRGITKAPNETENNYGPTVFKYKHKLSQDTKDLLSKRRLLV